MATNIENIKLGESVASWKSKTNSNFSALKEEVEKKVDKVEGKSLSTNDYTTPEKEKLASLNNYNDSELRTLIANKVDKVAGKGLSTNDFTTEEKQKLSGLSNYDDTSIKEDITQLQNNKADKSQIPDVSSFITRAVNDLENYYTKSQTYTQDEINQRISSIPKFNIQAVSSLPTANISETTVYLLKSNAAATDNLYEEYIYVGGVWELLGTQKVDLSGYQTIESFNVAIANYYTKSETDNLLATKVGYKEAIEIDGDVNPLKAYYTKAEVEELLANVKPNVDIVNENLLINGNFAIDQKAQGYFNCITKTYTVDRWLAYAGMRFQKLDSGAHIYNQQPSSSSKKGWFQQILDKPYLEFAGKDVALSIKVNDETFWGSCVIPEEMPTEETYFIEVNLGNQGGEEDAVLALVCSAEGRLSVALYVTCGASMIVEYVKLEFASTPTAFVPRPESEELALCQRYFQVLKGSAVNSFIGFAMTTGTDEIRSLSKNILQIPLVSHMRTNPSVRKIGSLYLVHGTTRTYVESYAYDNYNRHIVSVSLSSGNYADGTVTMATMTDEASRFEIDAEIY